MREPLAWAPRNRGLLYRGPQRTGGVEVRIVGETSAPKACPGELLLERGL